MISLKQSNGKISVGRLCWLRLAMEDITVKINRFYDLIRNYCEGEPNTRYKSWEWCHQAFLEKKEVYKHLNDETEKDQVVDYLSLHLAFYLASWGMYRGSSYLLQRDYKAHKEAVRCILDGDDLLWDYEPCNDNINKAKESIFKENSGFYWRIKNSYKNYEGNEDIPTDTLITKILMGTFGCVPAFDRYLKKGISVIRNVKYSSGSVGGYKLTQSIENVKGETFMALSKLAVDHKNEFKVESNIYPPMKCVDMYLWEIGYELDLADGLVNEKNNDKKKRELLEVVKSLRLCDEMVESFEEASRQIKSKNS